MKLTKEEQRHIEQRRKSDARAGRLTVAENKLRSGWAALETALKEFGRTPTYDDFVWICLGDGQ